MVRVSSGRKGKEKRKECRSSFFSLFDIVPPFHFGCIRKCSCPSSRTSIFFSFVFKIEWLCVWMACATESKKPNFLDMLHQSGFEVDERFVKRLSEKLSVFQDGKLMTLQEDAKKRLGTLGEHLVSKILKSWHMQPRSNKDLIKKICLETSWLDQIHLYTRSRKDLSKIWRSWNDYESQWSLPKILNETYSDTTSEQISKLFRIPWLFNRNILK